MRRPRGHSEQQIRQPLLVGGKDVNPALGPACFHHVEPPLTLRTVLKSCVVAVTVAPVRVVLLAVTWVFAYLWALLVTLGVHKFDAPYSRVRRFFVSGRLWVRLMLFFLGFHWIHIRRLGPRVPRKAQPLVLVSNHASYIDTMLLYWLEFPSFVLSRNYLSLPVMGRFAKAQQSLFVAPGTSSPEERQRSVTSQIAQRQAAAPGTWPRISVFPEGVSTNGRWLVSFHTGAFVGGYPVQPVAIKYRWRVLNPSPGQRGYVKHVFRLITQWHNSVEVTYLPVYHPSEEEQLNPAKYARNVRREMERVLEVPVMEASYLDKKAYYQYLNGEMSEDEYLATKVPSAAVQAAARNAEREERQRAAAASARRGGVMGNRRLDSSIRLPRGTSSSQGTGSSIKSVSEMHPGASSRGTSTSSKTAMSVQPDDTSLTPRDHQPAPADVSDVLTDETAIAAGLGDGDMTSDGALGDGLV